MTKLKIFLIIIICVTVFSCFSETKTIKIDEVGVMFEIPKVFIIVDEKMRRKPIAGNEELENKYGISYGYEKIDSEFLSEFRFKNKDEMLKRLEDKKSIFRGIKDIMHKFFKYDKKIIGEEILFSSDAEFDFSCLIFFIKEDYYVSISVSYYDPFREMQEKYPQYFEYRQDDTYWWKDEDKILKMIMNGDEDAPEELVKLYKYFQQIKESINFY